PVAERGRGLPDKKRAVAAGPQQRRRSHASSPSLSNSKRCAYARSVGSFGGALPTSRLAHIGATTHAPMNAPRLPCVRARTGTTAHCPATRRGAVAPRARPAPTPPTMTVPPARALPPSAPSDGANPRPPAPRRNGDQLWPAIAAPPAHAASHGRCRPASSGPTVALAMSAIPEIASGVKPVTPSKLVPQTVPPPPSPRSP